MRDELNSRVNKTGRKHEVGWHPRADANALAHVRSFILHPAALAIFIVGWRLCRR